jgi:hypothetical protein
MLLSRREVRRRKAHCSGIRDDFLDIAWGVDLVSGVGAIGGEFGKAWDDEGEGLGVDDVPVESVNLLWVDG